MCNPVSHAESHLLERHARVLESGIQADDRRVMPVGCRIPAKSTRERLMPQNFLECTQLSCAPLKLWRSLRRARFKRDFTVPRLLRVIAAIS